MPNGLDRLERLFSKRKHSSTGTNLSTDRTEPVIDVQPTQLDNVSFPQPSFLRPKGKGERMVARDESTPAERHDSRASSLPEARSERMSMHSSTFSTASTGDMNNAPAHNMSLILRRKNLHASQLKEFKFPLPPMHTTTISADLPTSPSCSPTTATPMGQRHLEHRHSSVILPSRADTPPASDHEDDLKFHHRQQAQSGSTPSLRPLDPPTPAASPEIKALSDPLDQEPDVGVADKRSMFAPLRRRKERKAAELRRAQSHVVLASTQTINQPKSVLKGGDVKDFFDLSDDDIAEEDLSADEPTTPEMAPYLRRPSTKTIASVRATTPMSKRSSTASVMNPLADAAAHGAVQIAKIAAKHKFDLVYIVNLWPEKVHYTSAAASMPTSGCESASSSRPNSARSSLLGSMEGTVVETAAGMTGRLLAAYGLSKVASPFRISAAVHAKILRHESWIEYRSADAKEGEFSRGYGHAFHAGFSRKMSTTTCVSMESRSEVDRGIVFAAYRQPGPDGKTRGCTPEELEALHADAEYLIDMLIAIHKAKRLRNPVALSAQANDVGPMPSQRGDVFL
ncbi:hypothetical protein BN1723_013162, partial [Verticillium longisporum]